MSPLMRRFIVLVAVLAVGGGLWGQDGFGQELVIAVIGMWLVVPWLLAIVVVALKGMIRGHRPEWNVLWLGGLCVVLAGLVLSYGVGRGMNRWQYQRTLAFVERAGPVLEEIKKATGAYPEALPAELAASLPAWLRHRGSYRREGDHYWFSYADPAGFFFNGVTFDSRDRQWRHDD